MGTPIRKYAWPRVRAASIPNTSAGILYLFPNSNTQSTASRCRPGPSRQSAWEPNIVQSQPPKRNIFFSFFYIYYNMNYYLFSSFLYHKFYLVACCLLSSVVITRYFVPCSLLSKQNGWGKRTWTSDLVINSHPLYQLSYTPIILVPREGLEPSHSCE